MATFILSDNSINSYGGRVLTKGLQLDRFRKNPVILFNHDRWYMPIGRWENIRIEGDQLLADASFDMDDELGKTVAGKVEKGVLSAASIGVDILESSTEPEFLVAGQTRGTVTKGEIYEASIVDIPGNKNAVKLRSANAGLTLSADADATIINQLLPSINCDMEKIALTLGLPKEATEDQIVLAIESLDSQAKQAVPALMALGLAKGVITEKTQEKYEKLAKADFDSTLELIQETEVAAPASTTDDTKETAPEKEATIKDLILALKKEGDDSSEDDRTKWTLNDWRKNDPKGLEKLQLESPEKFEKLMKPLRAHS